MNDTIPERLVIRVRTILGASSLSVGCLGLFMSLFDMNAPEYVIDVLGYARFLCGLGGLLCILLGIGLIRDRIVLLKRLVLCFLIYLAAVSLIMQPIFASSFMMYTATVTIDPTISIEYWFFDDFEEHAPGEQPDGWDPNTKTWQTVSDPSGSMVYEQTSTVSAGSASFAGRADWTDYTVDVRVKCVSGGLDDYRGACIYFRVVDSLNHFSLYLYPRLGRLGLFTMEQGDVKVIASVIAILVPNQWYQVRIRIQGNHASVWLDGEQVFTEEDMASKQSMGYIGVGTTYYHCRFDDVKVYPS